jgi:hypothetical protein
MKIDKAFSERTLPVDRAMANKGTARAATVFSRQPPKSIAWRW